MSVLKDYLEKVGGTKTFYRVKEIFGKKRLKKQIEFEKKEKIVKKIKEAVFENSPEDIYVFVSDRSWYTERDKEFRIASIVTLSLDKKKGKREFEKEVKKSNKLRKRELNFLEEEIKPFLKKMMKTDLVLAILLRGDLVDKDRYTTKFSDINILLLTNFKSDNKKKKEETIKLLKKTDWYIVLDYIYFKPNFHSGYRPLNEKKSDHRITFSVLSYLDFLDLYEAYKKENKGITKYELENFSKSKIIFQKQKKGRDFLKKISSLSTSSAT